MPFSSWRFRSTTIQFPAIPLLCISMHIHCGSSRLFSLTSLVNALSSRFQTFPYYSCAYLLCTFLWLCASHLLYAYALHVNSMPFRLVSRPVPTVLALICSARFHNNSIQYFSMPTHYFPMPSLTFPMQCISFLFHCLSWLFNAVTSLCSALRNVTLPSPSNAITVRFKANLFPCLATQINAIT